MAAVATVVAAETTMCAWAYNPAGPSPIAASTHKAYGLMRVIVVVTTHLVGPCPHIEPKIPSPLGWAHGELTD